MAVPINYNPSGEPVGFESRADSYFSFNNATRTFTIEPKSPYTSYNVWDGLTKYTKSAAESIQISNTVGHHYIYFVNGQLTEYTSFQGVTVPIVSMIHWDGLGYACLSTFYCRCSI
jgi:hypothetical protein